MASLSSGTPPVGGLVSRACWSHLSSLRMMPDHTENGNPESSFWLEVRSASSFFSAGFFPISGFGRLLFLSAARAFRSLA